MMVPDLVDPYRIYVNGVHVHSFFGSDVAVKAALLLKKEGGERFTVRVFEVTAVELEVA